MRLLLLIVLLLVGCASKEPCYTLECTKEETRAQVSYDCMNGDNPMGIDKFDVMTLQRWGFSLDLYNYCKKIARALVP